MKRLISIVLILMFTATLATAADRRINTPKVRYIEPKSEAVVDLTGKESLVFKWKSTPIPAGGRMAYKFNVYEEYGYEVVVDEKLYPKVFSIEVPVDKFENGMTYTWQVKQRDARSRVWSMDSRWSFTIKK